MQTKATNWPSCNSSLQNKKLTSKEKTSTADSLEEKQKAFLLENSPEKQYKICMNADLCFFGDSPTLAELSRDYGPGLPKAWLVPQISNLSDFCGLKQVASIEQIRELAIIINQNYYWLKTHELLLFFFRFKSNWYYNFYSYFNPMIILQSLKIFIKERIEAYDRHANDIYQKQLELDRSQSITYEEYQRRKANGTLDMDQCRN